MAIKEYADHPLSSVLPLMGQMEIRELAADIQLNGLRAPITLLDGKILDGRNRYRACRIIDVEPRYRDYNGEGDPIDFIVSANVKRRHLTAGQKGLVLAKIANLPRGNPNLKPSKTPTNPKSVQSTELEKRVSRLAKEIGISDTTAVQAKRVLRDAPAETVKAVEQGKKSVATAVRELRAEKKKETPKDLDKTGCPIPNQILENWKRADQKAREWTGKVSKIRSDLRSAFDEEDVIIAGITNDVLADLNNAYTSLKCIQPYAVCSSCQGVQSKKCGLCKGRGFLDHFAWKTFVPEEARKLREKK